MKHLTNFLEETIRCLNENGKTEEDVLWVGRGFGKLSSFSVFSNLSSFYSNCFSGVYMPEAYKSTWDDFKSKADFNYDDGYGMAYIPTDLVVVGKDFWLERATYDGSEWWAFKTAPTEPALTRELDLSDVDLSDMVLSDADLSDVCADYE